MSHNNAGIITGSDEISAAYSEAWNLRHTRATAPPGEGFHYSNSGYKVLGLVLQTVLEQPTIPLGPRDGLVQHETPDAIPG